MVDFDFYIFIFLYFYFVFYFYIYIFLYICYSFYLFFFGFFCILYHDTLFFLFYRLGSYILDHRFVSFRKQKSSFIRSGCSSPRIVCSVSGMLCVLQYVWSGVLWLSYVLHSISMCLMVM